MWNFLEKLRQKNDAQKLVIAVGASALITFVIAATWIAAITVSNKSAEEKVEIKPKEEVTPISNISEQAGELKTMFSDLFKEFRSSKEVFENLPESSEQMETTASTTEAGSEINVENATNSTTTIEIESNVE